MNQDVCGRYTALEYIPTCVECFYRKQSFHFSDLASAAAPAQDLDLPIPYISIGDSEGGVHIIKLHVEFGLSTEVGMKKKNQILFAQSVEVLLIIYLFILFLFLFLFSQGEKFNFSKIFCFHLFWKIIIKKVNDYFVF